MHRLIVTDLDGTLLNDDHVVPADTIEAFREIHALGNAFVFASGRHFIDVRGVRETIGVPAYIISSNGARVHAPDDSLVYERSIDPSIADAIMNTHVPDGIVRNVFTSTEWLIDREAPALLDFHRDSGFTYRVADMGVFTAADVAKLLFIGEPALLHSVEKATKASYGAAVSTTYSLPDCLEFMAQSVSKGAALLAVMKLLGAAPEVVLAFGDNLNDVEMLRVAGSPHVMANAHPKLFELFPNAARIGRNTEGAVATALRQLLTLPADRAIERLA
jgi:Cof subfamily protein (haloacid dehalogenase superfamily)